MGDLIRRLMGLPTKAESRAIADRERAERAARDIRLACDHDCGTCDYFSLVYELTSSVNLQIDCSATKAEHVEACKAGQPTSGSCVSADLQ